MDVVQIIHTITDPTRFRLLELLAEHHYCVKALSKKVGISEPAVSQQMKILKQQGIVKGVKIGYQTHYQVDKERILFCLNELSQTILQYRPDVVDEKGFDCSCEFISECVKRDTKLLEEENGGK